MELKMKLVSALEKVFLDEEPVEKPEAGPIEGFQNETISFQVAFSLVSPDARLWVWPKITSPIAHRVRVRTVRKWTRDPEAPENLRLALWDAAMVEELFEPGSVDRIYLNFPDPWPKPRHEKRRLTSPSFLRAFAAVLKPGGQLEFKTDNQDLFTYSLEQFEGSAQFVIDEVTRDLHAHARLAKDNIMTEYEEKFSEQGMPICKLVALRAR